MLLHPENKTKEEEKEYEYIGKKFNRRYLIASKSFNCKPSKRLDEMLTDVLEGDFDDQITKFTSEANPEEFNAIMEETKAKKTPVIVDLETGRVLAGFKIPKLAKFLK